MRPVLISTGTGTGRKSVVTNCYLPCVVIHDRVGKRFLEKSPEPPSLAQMPPEIGSVRPSVDRVVGPLEIALPCAQRLRELWPHRRRLQWTDRVPERQARSVIDG